jgi:predicted DNA-binding transcriptional regulator AlpA
VGAHTGRPGRDPEGLDLYGRGWEEGRRAVLSDLGALPELEVKLGIARNTLHWYANGRHSAPSPFPQPVLRISDSRVWLMSEVEAWLREWHAVRQPGHRTDLEREHGGAATYPERARKPRERKTGRSVPRKRSKSPTAISSDVPNIPAGPRPVSLSKSWVRVCKRALCKRPPMDYSDWCAEHEPEV